MQEFMFFIRKQARSETRLEPAEHRKFLDACAAYIDRLKGRGRLIAAQPIAWAGAIIAAGNDTWLAAPFDEQAEVIGGYYHILAKDLDDAISVARDNPEFQFNPDTRIEVRPLIAAESTTGYVYPAGERR